MKNLKYLAFGVITLFVLESCGQKHGCPQSGAAIGAERLLSGDPKAAKLAKKSKFRGNGKRGGLFK